jgi:hypothetical protein
VAMRMAPSPVRADRGRPRQQHRVAHAGVAAVRWHVSAPRPRALTRAAPRRGGTDQDQRGQQGELRRIPAIGTKIRPPAIRTDGTLAFPRRDRLAVVRR